MYWNRIAAVLACIVLLGAGAVVAAPGSGATVGTEIQFDPPVPQEYSFDPPTADGVARVDGQQFDRLDGALAAADPGDTVTLRGRFDTTVTIETRGLTIRSAGDGLALIDGRGEGNVVTINATGVTVRRVWVRNAGYDPAENDAAVWVERANVTVVDSRVTDTTFGIWVNGARNVRLVDNTIVGRESVTPLTNRGNGIQLWQADDALVADNRITDVRDGIYYSWSSDVLARNNTMWDIRYGVHYMYSDDCTLVNNTSFDNDVGYALMVSQNLRILNNTAVNNTGQSGHGIMVKSIDDSVIRGNELVGNHKGMFVFNSLHNTIANNLVLQNDIGIHLSAGSVHERVVGNTFVRNAEEVRADVGRLVAWNGTRRGNYWGEATPTDVDSDGVSETRYRAAGAVQRLQRTTEGARLFTGSPAFDVVRRAERTLPVVQSPGVVDWHPLAAPPHDWREYYDST